METPRLILLGPPGSGKGTQASRLADELDVRHISTGDLLRDAVKEGAELGKQAEGYMKRGALVPDDVMLGLVRDELAARGSEGWILDGFPRTLEQAEGLAEMLDEIGQGIETVVVIDVDPEIIVRRLTGRRVCPKCNAVYNLESNAPSDDMKCDECGAQLVQRPDDREETVRKRLEVYEEQTEPLIEYYRIHEDLVTVDGSKDIEEISAEILRAVE